MDILCEVGGYYDVYVDQLDKPFHLTLKPNEYFYTWLTNTSPLLRINELPISLQDGAFCHTGVLCIIEASVLMDHHAREAYQTILTQ